MIHVLEASACNSDARITTKLTLPTITVMNTTNEDDLTLTNSQFNILMSFLDG